jgi:hypothetical protein
MCYLFTRPWLLKLEAENYSPNMKIMKSFYFMQCIHRFETRGNCFRRSCIYLDISKSLKFWMNVTETFLNKVWKVMISETVITFLNDCQRCDRIILFGTKYTVLEKNTGGCFLY